MQESGPSCHLEDFYDPNIRSPEVDKRPQWKKKLTKKLLYWNTHEITTSSSLMHLKLCGF